MRQSRPTAVGHYVKFPFMHSGVAASELQSSLEATISLANFA